MNAIEFIDFNTFYGSKPVLQNINLGFDSNSITAIIGPSGCGKTTSCAVSIVLLKWRGVIRGGDTGIWRIDYGS